MAEQQGDATASARILVVDDNLANLILAQKLLEQHGFTNVETEQDSRRVVERCRAQAYDLLLIDVRMPYLDGFQVVEQLRPIYGNDYLPILMLTAQTDDETRKRALQMGVRDFLTKPFISWELLHRIRNMLEVRLLYRQARRTNERLEAEVRQRTAELHNTRVEVIRRLVTAAEFRDNDTGAHVVRISQLAGHIATALGLPPEQVELIQEAAPMHDIGKIGIPDAILIKPHRLNAEEWEVMKTHTTIGAQILAGSGFELLQVAHDIALTHHERWDGSGYPRGLKGDEIPMAGRIVALVDVFDAICSVRPYKPAWPVEQAVELITEGAGHHFDPQLVQIFLAELPALTAIRDRFADPA